MSGRRLGFLLALALVVSALPLRWSSADPPRRCALLVGIDDYSGAPGADIPASQTWPSLRGSRNDVAELGRVLRDVHGFEVATLLDEAASASGLERAFREHLIQCVSGPEDVAFFHYSGHGQQIPDDDGDEVDGWDEAIVPFDHRGRLQPDAYVRDDAIFGWLEQLGEKTPQVTLSFDSCHSGTAHRSGSELGQARGLPRERSLRAGAGRTSAPAARASGFFDDAGERPRWLMLAAAQADEQARETTRPDCDPEEDCVMGRFSHWLSYELERAPAVMSHGELLDRVAARLRRRSNLQTPNLQGEGRRLLFTSGEAAPSLPSFVVAPASRTGTMRLLGGLVHGLSEGTVLDLYPLRGVLEDGDEPIARAVVERARDLRETTTRIKVRAGDEASDPALLMEPLRARENHSLSAPKPVRLRLESGAPGLRAALEEIGFVDVLESAPEGEAAAPYRLTEETGELVLRAPSGAALSFPQGAVLPSRESVAPDDPALAARLRTALELELRRRRVLGLVRPDSAAAFPLGFGLCLGGPEGCVDAPAPDEPGPTSAGALSLADSGGLCLQAHNGAESRVFLALVHLQPDGRIATLDGRSYPAFDEPLEPGGSFGPACFRLQPEDNAPGVHEFVLLSMPLRSELSIYGYDIDSGGLGSARRLSGHSPEPSEVATRGAPGASAARAAHWGAAHRTLVVSP